MIPEEHKRLMESEEYVTEVLFPLAILAGKMIYSRYFSAEAKRCTGKTGFIRSRCLTRARIAGLAAQVKELSKHKDGCKTKKNKLDCSDRIEKQIGKLKAKRHKLSIKLISYNYRQQERKRKKKESKK